MFLENNPQVSFYPEKKEDILKMEKMWKTKKNAGLTLLEVIVAVSIFSVAALVLLQGFVLSGRINRTSALYMSATDLAQNVMEDIKSKDFAELSTAFNDPCFTCKGRCRYKRTPVKFHSFSERTL